MYKKYKNAFFLVFMLAFLAACGHKVNNETPSDVCGYKVSLPDGWQEVAKKEDVMKMVFWGFSNSNYTRFTEEPLFRAWRAPDENTFLTVMELKRHRNFGASLFGDEIMRTLPDSGWKIQEKGTTQIDSIYCKWWIQSHLNGALQQQSFLIGKGAYYYTFVFSTSYLSEERQKMFENVMKTVTFYKGL